MPATALIQNPLPKPASSGSPMLYGGEWAHMNALAFGSAPTQNSRTHCSLRLRGTASRSAFGESAS